jgi:hypothetical protein
LGEPTGDVDSAGHADRTLPVQYVLAGQMLHRVPFMMYPSEHVQTAAPGSENEPDGQLVASDDPSGQWWLAGHSMGMPSVQ